MSVANRRSRLRRLPYLVALGSAALAACAGGSNDPVAKVPGPTDLAVAPLTSSRLGISWTDGFTDETGFRVERGPSAAGPFVEVTITAADVASVIDEGLAPSTTYFYRVAAERPAGTTAFSAPVDATTPAATLGTLMVHEVSYPSLPELGQGLRVEASFVLNGPVPVFEETPGSVTGCKVWELNQEEVLATWGNVNRGPLVITSADSSPLLPPCTADAFGDYHCVSGFGTGGTIASAGAGIFSLSDADASFSSADAGRHVFIQGATNAANNGLFPIVSLAGSTTIVAVSASFVPETLPASAFWGVFAGVGPMPGLADPGLLEDDDALTFTLDQGQAIDAFAATVAVADDFALDASSTALLSSVPLDAGAFTLSCEAGQCGAGTGDATILEIRTTDAGVAGRAAHDLPLPVVKGVLIRCLGFSATSLTVPAAASAFLQSSGATRIETRFLRSGAAAPAVGEPVTVLAGHALIGITNP